MIGILLLVNLLMYLKNENRIELGSIICVQRALQCAPTSVSFVNTSLANNIILTVV